MTDPTRHRSRRAPPKRPLERWLDRLRALFGAAPKQPTQRRRPAKAAKRPSRPGTSAPSHPPRRQDTPARKALIAEAMRVHRAKRGILDTLGDEDRILLEVLAHHLLVVEPEMRARKDSSGVPHAPDRAQGDGAPTEPDPAASPASPPHPAAAQSSAAQSSIDDTPGRPQATSLRGNRR
ncbi:hypothetical protein HNR56_001754 [Roseospira marina]|nr:hypothetical protein [Roseospira marina]MBB5087061.1 hypothetical protein [Roseospira marina]